MKKLIIPAFVLALAAGAPALAWSQDDHHDKDKPHAAAGQGDEAKPEKATHEEKAPKAPKAPKVDRTGGGAMSGAEKTRTDERERTRDLNRTGVKTDTKTESNFTGNKTDNNNKNDNSKNDNNRDRGDNNKHDDHNNNNNNNSNDHRSNAGVHVNVNISTYRRTVTASRHFHAGAYRQPAHYSYRRWGLGERLPADYYARDYWLLDFATYDLIAPPDGYVWVRFGPDALLIDEDTGEVIQVVYGVFD